MFVRGSIFWIELCKKIGNLYKAEFIRKEECLMNKGKEVITLSKKKGKEVMCLSGAYTFRIEIFKRI